VVHTRCTGISGQGVCAGPECFQPEEVQGDGHVRVVEAGLGQAAVAGAPGAVAGGLVHGALDPVKTYHGFPHGMPATQAETINAGLLAFLQA
jgi:hypothetical protein